MLLNETKSDIRRNAIKKALATNSLSGFEPTDFGHAIYQQWIDGLDVIPLIQLIKDHYKELESAGLVSDGKAKQNLLGITDSSRLHNAEADLTTLRMAELLV